MGSVRVDTFLRVYFKSQKEVFDETKKILPLLSRSLFSLLVSPLPVVSAESDQANLIASLNSKTAMIRGEAKYENKNLILATGNLEINSYIFTLDQKDKLSIEFNEEIQAFKNGQYIDKNLSVGKASSNPAEIEPERIEIAGDLINIICRDPKNCVNRDQQVREINSKGEITYKRTANNLAGQEFHFRGLYNQPLAEQIKKDLQAIFLQLALTKPPPKPEP